MSTRTDSEATAQAELASIAQGIQTMRSRLARVMDSLSPEQWPPEVVEGTARPSLAYRLHCDIGGVLLDEHLIPAALLARQLSVLTPEEVLKDWKADLAERALAEQAVAVDGLGGQS